MMNVDLKTPGLYERNISTTVPLASTSRRLWITQSGFTGPKPSVLGINPYTLQVWDFSADRLRQYKVNGKTDSGPHMHPTTPGVEWWDGLNHSVPASKALDKLNEKTRGSLDLSVDIAEAGQTFKMFKVVDQVVNLTRTTFARFGALRAPANVWLQYTYGVKPLLSSIHGAAEESIRVVLNRMERYSARGTVFVDNPRFRYYSCENGWVTVTAKGRLKMSTTYGVQLQTRDGFDLMRWTSLNPVSIAWELMPYSFVVDWFLDVGSTIRNFETACLLQSRFVQGYRTDLTAFDGVYDNSTNTSSYYNSWKGNVKFLRINRTKLASYPVPRLPTFRAELGSSRLLSAAALMAQFLRR